MKMWKISENFSSSEWLIIFKSQINYFKHNFEFFNEKLVYFLKMIDQFGNRNLSEFSFIVLKIENVNGSFKRFKNKKKYLQEAIEKFFMAS